MNTSLSYKSLFWLRVAIAAALLSLGLQVAYGWVAPTATPPNGNVGLRQYVSDCNSFASYGWSSKQECLTDGRVHVVQTTLGAANADLIDAMTNGADIKIGYTNLSGAVNVKDCTKAFTYGGYAYCMEAVSYGGSVSDTVPTIPPANVIPDQRYVFNGSIPQPNRTWGKIGSGLIRSDGKSRGVDIVSATDGAEDVARVRAGTGSLSSLNWYARY